MPRPFKPCLSCYNPLLSSSYCCHSHYCYHYQRIQYVPGCVRRSFDTFLHVSSWASSSGFLGVFTFNHGYNCHIITTREACLQPSQPPQSTSCSVPAKPEAKILGKEAFIRRAVTPWCGSPASSV